MQVYWIIYFGDEWYKLHFEIVNIRSLSFFACVVNGGISNLFIPSSQLAWVRTFCRICSLEALMLSTFSKRQIVLLKIIHLDIYIYIHKAYYMPTVKYMLILKYLKCILEKNKTLKQIHISFDLCYQQWWALAAFVTSSIIDYDYYVRGKIFLRQSWSVIKNYATEISIYWISAVQGFSFFKWCMPLFYIMCSSWIKKWNQMEYY